MTRTFALALFSRGEHLRQFKRQGLAILPAVWRMVALVKWKYAEIYPDTPYSYAWLMSVLAPRVKDFFRATLHVFEIGIAISAFVMRIIIHHLHLYNP